MQQEHSDVHTAAVKVGTAWVLTIGGLSLTEWAALAGLVSALAAIVYTVLQTYVLWRDKIKRKKD